MKYFNNVNCIEDLKKQYFALAKKFHSDITGGSDEKMKELNAEYSELHKRYKDIHENVWKAEGEQHEPYYTAKTATKETAEDFINIISFLLGLGGLDVELCGRWIWIGGDTKAHKDLLKQMGCKWCSKKKLWSWHFNGDDTGYKKKGSSMSEIRSKYGSMHFRSDDEQLLLA